MTFRACAVEAELIAKHHVLCSNFRSVGCAEIAMHNHTPYYDPLNSGRYGRHFSYLRRL